MLPRRHDTDVNILALVRDWLQGEDVAQWLMILDNADSVEMLSPKNRGQDDINTLVISYLPKTGNGKILVLIGE